MVDQLIRFCDNCSRVHAGKCGFVPNAAPQPTCAHRTQRIGGGSCGCGSFFECSELGGYCSDHQPTEELYTITLNFDAGGSIQLSEATYHHCHPACPGFHAI
jgi:hypothetical protein